MNFADNPSNASNNLPDGDNNATASVRDCRAPFLSRIVKKKKIKRVMMNALKTPEEEVQPEVKRVKRIVLKMPEGEVHPEEITTRSRTTYTTKQRDSLKAEIETTIEKQHSLKTHQKKILDKFV